MTEGKKVIIRAFVFSEETKTFTTKPITKDNAINLMTIPLPIPPLLKRKKVQKASAIFKIA